MGISRRGMRSLVVNGTRYFWKAKGTDDGIDLRVVTEDAFGGGVHGQQLYAGLPYDSVFAPCGSGWALEQRTAVAPGLVRKAIERGLALGFTGEVGKADAILSVSDVQAVMEQTPFERLRDELVRATRMLKGSPPTDRDVTLFFGQVLAIGILAHRHPGAEVSQAIYQWMRECEQTLHANRALLQSYVDALVETLGRPWTSWGEYWLRCCERRSAVEFLRSFAAESGMADLLDCSVVDAKLQERGAEVERLSLTTGVGAHVPQTHGWWRLGKLRAP